MMTTERRPKVSDSELRSTPKVLVVAAHPDDMEILCAGTLALLSRSGYEVVVSHMTFGDKGGREDPAELARTRAEEAARSAEIIGAKVYGRICGDLELYASPGFVDTVAELIRETTPDVILTHRQDDYHPDHRITGELVLSALSTASLSSSLWFMDSIGGVNFQPTHVVDVSDVFATKAEMIRCHVSQMKWMSQARRTDMVYMAEWTGRWRALQAGWRVAEAFQRHDQSSTWFAPELTYRELEEQL